MQITNGTPEQCTAETDEIPSTEIGWPIRKRRVLQVWQESREFLILKSIYQFSFPGMASSKWKCLLHPGLQGRGADVYVALGTSTIITQHLL
jgi:hypothetical protein